jgi:hypothetical protein
LRWPQALHFNPRVVPHPSQYSLVALFWQPQRKHCIERPLEEKALHAQVVITPKAGQFYAALQCRPALTMNF